MKPKVIRYRTKPESAEENARLVAQVFKELNAGPPREVRYMVVRFADDSFMHVVFDESGRETSPLFEVEAFRAFQSGIKARLIEGPLSADVTVVGSYRMMDERNA
jgi:hypothetical protein